LRLRERVEKVLDWARVKKYREGENPARWKGNLKLQMPSLPKKSERVEHMPALAYGEMPAFMAKLRALDDSLHRARALEWRIFLSSAGCQCRRRYRGKHSRPRERHRRGQASALGARGLRLRPSRWRRAV